MRQTSQCVGRIIRSKYDYGLMIFSDKRYAKPNKKGKLPRWIKSHFNEGCENVSVEQALSIASNFYKDMG